jgi:hypothetical protein
MSDEPSKLGTHYSIGQREYFKHVVRLGTAFAPQQTGMLLHQLLCGTAGRLAARRLGLDGNRQPCHVHPGYGYTFVHCIGPFQHHKLLSFECNCLMSASFLFSCIPPQLEAIAIDPDAEAGVGSASGMQLLNMDLSRQAASAAAQDDEAGAATQVSALDEDACITLAHHAPLLGMDLLQQAAQQEHDEAAAGAQVRWCACSHEGKQQLGESFGAVRVGLCHQS